jgi:hypothetical protein
LGLKNGVKLKEKKTRRAALIEGQKAWAEK